MRLSVCSGASGDVAAVSVALYRSRHLEQVGQLTGLGWKCGRRLDTVYMQNALGGDTASALKPVNAD